MSRASGWRWPTSGPQGPRAELRIRPEALSLGGLICEVGRSRTWNPSRLAVEPGLPARVEKGAWRGARLPAVPAGGSPPSGCRLLATPGTGTPGGRSGLRAEEAALPAPRARGGPPGRAGGAGGRQRRGIHYPTTQSTRPVLRGSVPLPPIPARLLLRRCPGSPGGGTRGAAAEGSGAAVAHAPGPRALQLPRPQLALLPPAPASGS